MLQELLHTGMGAGLLLKEKVEDGFSNSATSGDIVIVANNSLSTTTLSGITSFKAGGKLNMKSGSTMHIKSETTIDMDATTELDVDSALINLN